MPLRVYKASAGSGKTYELTRQYLSILKKNLHSQILAVTFTNKATEEMKERIVEALYTIAEGLGPANGYTPQEAAQKLSEILHDYSRFNVSTIDGFFQKVLRAFVRELGIFSTYALLINSKDVLNHSLDEFLLSLDQPQYQNTYDWLLRWAKEKIRNGADWNIKDQLLLLGEELFQEDVSEKLKAHADQLTSENIGNFVQGLKDQRQTILKDLEKLAKKAKTDYLSTGYQLEDSSRKALLKLKEFKGKDWVPLTPTFLAMENDCTKAFSKDFQKKHPGLLDQLQAVGFDQDIHELIAYYNQNQETYYSIEVIVQSLDLVPMLLELNNFIDAYLRENNEVLLSTVNQFIKKIINGCDAPFIYEKLGYQLRNYMLDEFQDTSTMQWENFFPLIDNSVANHDENLVVGDIKQSIYRWRNSDWNILASKLPAAFSGRMQLLNLSTNWRSDARIIQFNNAFFPQWARMLDATFAGEYCQVNQVLKVPTAYENLLQTAYAEVEQEMPPKKDPTAGYVRVETFDKLKEEKKEGQLDRMNQALLENLQELFDKGYQKKDIAILVRKNAEGIQMAELLLSHGIPVVSSESLLISHSPAVRLLVAVIGLMSNTDKAFFQQAANFIQEISATDEDLEKASALPLFEAVEQYIQILHLNEEPNNTIYLQSFQDLVADYVSHNGSDASSFIAWWNEEGVNKTVATNQTQDAVQIMTIHKSKGLAFDIVMMPYCDVEWSAGRSKLMWCEPPAPYQQIPVVPVFWDKKMPLSCFKEEYFKEKLYQYVDALNTLYVGFTRPKHALFVYARQVNKEKNENMYGLLTQLFNPPIQPEGATIEQKDFSDVYTLGTLPALSSQEKEEDHDQLMDTYFTQSFSEHQLKLRLQAETTHQQREGNALHQVLSFMVGKEDLPAAIRKTIRMGRLLPSQQEWAEAEIQKVLDNPLTQSWFDGTYTKVLNESSIIAALHPNEEVEGGSVYRPDRILLNDTQALIVDYKFGQPEKKYHYQIRRYMRLLQQMHRWEKIEGCLYYHQTGTVEPVSFSDTL